jgi:hypothetical protein
MGSFFSKIFVRNPEGYQQLPKQNLNEVFYQVAIKKGSIQNEKDKNDKIIKCLQVSDFLSRPINYKVRNVQNGGDIYKKPLFIFCCKNTFEARMTLYFSWIRMISPIFPILILGSPNKNNNKNQNWNTFQFDSNELKKLAYNSPNFSLKKIPLNFVYYSRDPTNQNAIIEYYTKRQNINLADYDGVKLVFVQDFPDRKECELLDSNKNPVFPGAWVNSEFIKNGIFKKDNPLVDGLFLPDSETLINMNDLDKLTKLEEYLRFLMMHYSGNLGKSKNFKNIKLPDNYFFNYQNMRQILIKKINNLKESEQKST